MKFSARATASVLLMIGIQPAWALDGECPFRQYGHDIWQTTGGSLNNKVQSISQTLHGYLCLGTPEAVGQAPILETFQLNLSIQ